jgi:hypothetical protein
MEPLSWKEFIIYGLAFGTPVVGVVIGLLLANFAKKRRLRRWQLMERFRGESRIHDNDFRSFRNGME